MQYEVGISLQQAREAGLIAKGVAPLPRDMAFPVPKGGHWHDLYDYIRWVVVRSMVSSSCRFLIKGTGHYW